MTIRSVRKPLLVLAALLLLVTGFGLKGARAPHRSNHWSLESAMGSAREGACAVGLPGGRALIAGGSDSRGPLASAELYGADGKFTSAASMSTAGRSSVFAAAAARGGGAELWERRARGGIQWIGRVGLSGRFQSLGWIFVAVGKMSTPRQNHSITLLLDGRVLIAGGSNGAAELASMEVFDPIKGGFQSVAPMAAPRQGHLTFRLPNNNQILLAGGASGGNAVAAAELFTPWTGKLQPAESLSMPRVASFSFFNWKITLAASSRVFTPSCSGASSPRPRRRSQSANQS